VQKKISRAGRKNLVGERKRLTYLGLVRKTMKIIQSEKGFVWLSSMKKGSKVKLIDSKGGGYGRKGL